MSQVATTAAGRGLRVVQVALSIQVGAGGPARSVTSLCQAIARRDCRVDLCSVHWGRAFGMETVPVDPALVAVHMVRGFPLKRQRMWLTWGFEKLVARHAAGADIVHTNGFWVTCSHNAAQAARRLGLPHVISIRGGLSPEALKISTWKKRISRWLFADANLRNAACLHALTDQEARNIRDFGLGNPVAVIPNGVDLEAMASLPPKDTLARRREELAGKKVVLYLGRIHPSKGLRHLVDAWCRLAGRWEDWHLVIAGPDEVGQQAELTERIRQARAETSVTFFGPAYGQDKLMLLAGADLFTLPSFSEGFSMSLLEALAAGLPILFTPACNFNEAVSIGAGLSAEPTAEAFKTALGEIMGLPAARRQEMGLRGRRLVEEKYSWDLVAGQMIEVYRWLTGGGPAPACVMGGD